MLPRPIYFLFVLLTRCLSDGNILAIQEEVPRQSLEPEPIIAGDAHANGTTLTTFFVEYHHSNSSVKVTIAMKWINGWVKAECRVMPEKDFPFYVVVNKQM
ncbi:hypothetical protein Y032_0058g2933 [Ancylostoma ceylanicum]|uniref:Uncharacterized protein n=1 Tax=Ancylostoma ceylanicum TaxID=53326 RepID=A0A016U3Y8_9BILA|nr:hypothetical protein Y032_0058g2933 [Ancylostoma ceylanicum]